MYSDTRYSFDVFDTSVVRRVARPDDLHYLTGRLLLQANIIACKEVEWHKARVDAEQLARYEMIEPQLIDIYKKLAIRFAWTSSQSWRAEQLEMRVEAASVFPIASTIDALRAHDPALARPIFISDTAIKSAGIGGLLKKVGLTVDTTAIYASCDQGASKQSGALYNVVLKSEMLEACNLQHTGDNYCSDVVVAKAHGLKSTLFTKSSFTGYEQAMLNTTNRGSFEASIVVGAARAARLSRRLADAIWETSTGVAGPVLTSFVLWTVLDAQRRGIKRLYFLARDGQILAQLGRSICHWAKIDIECRYLLASRQALHLASLPANPSVAIHLALMSGQGRPIGEVLDELEFAEPTMSDFLTGAGLRAEDELTELAVGRIELALQGSSIFRTFAAILAERREALRIYLFNQGLYNPEPAAIVDLGWRGNLQLRLDKILLSMRAQPIFGYYYSLYVIPISLKDRVSTYASADVSFNPHLLETFCKADHRSVLGFTFNDDRQVRAIDADVLDDEAICWGVRRQQEGINAYCRCLIQGLELVDPVELLNALRPAALQSFKRFIRRPAVADAHAYGSVRHAADQTHRNEQELAPLLGTFKLLLLLSNPRRRRAASRWAGGLVSRATDNALGRLLCAGLALPDRLKRTRHDLRYALRLDTTRADASEHKERRLKATPNVVR